MRFKSENGNEQNLRYESYELEKHDLKSEEQAQHEVQNLMTKVNTELIYQEQQIINEGKHLEETVKENFSFSINDTTLKDISQIDLAEELTEKKKDLFFSSPKSRSQMFLSSTQQESAFQKTKQIDLQIEANSSGVEIQQNNQFFDEIDEKYGKFEYLETQLDDGIEVQDKQPIKYLSGIIYIGQFDDKGKKHGKGIQIWPDGNKYEGFWKGGKANGRGRMILDSKDVYEGEWVDNYFHGLGTYFYYDGRKYTGQ